VTQQDPDNVQQAAKVGVGRGGARAGAGRKPMEPREQVWSRLTKQTLEVIDDLRGAESRCAYFTRVFEGIAQKELDRRAKVAQEDV